VHTIYFRENGILLGYYTVSNGNFNHRFETTYQSHVLLTLEDGTDILSRNVSNKLPPLTM
jgi:hypothetical protein